MAMTPEYIALCRKLNLPRPILREGDWWVWADESTGRRYKMAGAHVAGSPMASTTKGYERVWLPREGDILDLLEAEGAERIAFGKTGFGDWWSEVTVDDRVYNVPHPDRCTALLRLYLAVRESQQ